MNDSSNTFDIEFIEEQKNSNQENIDIDLSNAAALVLETLKNNQELISSKHFSDETLESKLSNLIFEANAENSRVAMSKKVDEIFRFYAKNYERSFEETYYKSIKEYHGVVESVDFEKGAFQAILHDPHDLTDVLNAEFGFDDLQYKSDIELVVRGANFVWVIGQEAKLLVKNNYLIPGPQTNISKFIFRRTRVLDAKKIEEAKNDAREWTEFFNTIFPDTTED